MGDDLRTQLAAIKHLVPKADGKPVTKAASTEKNPEKEATQSTSASEDTFAQYCSTAGVKSLSSDKTDKRAPGRDNAKRTAEARGGQRAPTKPIGKSRTQATRPPNPPSPPGTDSKRQAPAPALARHQSNNRKPTPRSTDVEHLDELARYSRGLTDIYGSRNPPTPAPVASSFQQDEVELESAPLSETRASRPIRPLGKSPLVPVGRDTSYLESGWRINLEATGSARPHRLIIGVDFGTAYTKVCIGEPRVAYAVEFFPRAQGIARYLLPGVLLVDRAGHCHLGELDSQAQQFENLKLPLLERKATMEDYAKVLAFLALVIRYSRTWLLREQRDVYRNLSLHWELNVGLPTDSWGDQTLSCDYRALSQLAWLLSVEEAPVSLARAGELAARLKDAARLLQQHERSIHEGSINVAPEFAAQIASYDRLQRNPDLHLMVDIGAGTVDITTFNVHDDPEAGDVLPVFAAKVVRYGTHYLMAARLHAIEQDLDWSDMAAIPTTEQLAAETGCDLDTLQRCEKAFCLRVANVIGRVLHHTKRVRYSHSSRWQDAVPTFLCGGGSNIAVYATALDGTGFRLQLIGSTVPRRLHAQGIDSQGFGRLSVAFGLSYSIDDLGKLVPPSAVPDDPQDQRAARDYTDTYTGKEQT